MEDGVKKKAYKRSDFHLKPEEVKLLIKSAESLRDKIIIKILAYCGLRRFELAKIKIEDLNLEAKEIQILGKRNVERISVIFSEQLVEDLKVYVRHVLNNPKTGYLFPAVSSLNNKGHISYTEINRIVAKAGKKAGLKNPNPDLKNINPHTLRHTCARMLKDKGYNLEVVQQVLGHLSQKITTDLYGTKSIHEMREELKKAGDVYD